MPSVEAKWGAVTAVAPIAWGANYVVTREWLPADAPLWGSALRALPAGLLLLALTRRLPRGSWWWRAAVLGVLNVGAFFLLVYLAAQLLPSNVAASVMSLSPLALAGFGWLLVGDRPTARIGVGALAGVAGVMLLVGGASGRLPPLGIAASLAALVLSSVGAVLATRWRGELPVLATTAWQLVAGGLLLTVTAAAVEGGPPRLSASGVLAMIFCAVVATAVANVCWFAGLSRLRTGTVGVIGTLNPLTGVTLGALVAGEGITPAQGVGIALTLAGIAVASRAGNRPSGALHGPAHRPLTTAVSAPVPVPVPCTPRASTQVEPSR